MDRIGIVVKRQLYVCLSMTFRYASGMRSKEPLFNLRLSADERAALERARAAMGHRSAGDTLRAWIANSIAPSTEGNQMTIPTGIAIVGCGLAVYLLWRGVRALLYGLACQAMDEAHDE